jgi:hypothetical protein
MIYEKFEFLISIQAFIFAFTFELQAQYKEKSLVIRNKASMIYEKFKVFFIDYNFIIIIIFKPLFPIFSYYF